MRLMTTRSCSGLIWTWQPGKWLIDVENRTIFSSRAKRVPNRGRQNRGEPDMPRSGRARRLQGPHADVRQARRWGSRYPMPVSALICFCTCPDADQRRAHRHRAACLRRLAACVNLLPGLRWSIAGNARSRPGRGPVLVKTMPRPTPPCGTPAPTASLRTPGAARGRSRVQDLPEYLQWLAAESQPVNWSR